MDCLGDTIDTYECHCKAAKAIVRYEKSCFFGWVADLEGIAKIHGLKV